MAGGLHKKVDSHAKPIAHMALKMMELSEEVLTPDGKPIKVCFFSLITNQYLRCLCSWFNRGKCGISVIKCFLLKVALMETLMFPI